jgi:hypothetical protein
MLDFIKIRKYLYRHLEFSQFTLKIGFFCLFA